MPLFLLHAALMAIGFFFVLAALIVARTQRRKRWWLKVHQAVGIAGGLSMILGAIAAVASVASNPDGEHLRTPHTWVGALTVLTAILTLALGRLQFKIPGKATAIRKAHRLCGRTLNVLSPIAIWLGLRLAELV
jgi:heme A synthase